MKARNRYENFEFPDSLWTIDCEILDMKSWEAKNSYLQLLRKKADDYITSNNIPFDTNEIKNGIKILYALLKRIKSKLDQERKENIPLGMRFEYEVIEIELSNYGSYEEQIEYLKNKQEHLRELTINLPNKNYRSIESNLKELIKKRMTYIYNYYRDSFFDFNVEKILVFIKNIRKKKDRASYVSKVLEQSVLISETLKILNEKLMTIDEVEIMYPQIANRFYELYRESETLWKYLSCIENCSDEGNSSISEYRRKRKRRSELRKIFSTIKELPNILANECSEIFEIDHSYPKRFDKIRDKVEAVDNKDEKMIWYGERRDFVAFFEALRINKRIRLTPNKCKCLCQYFTWPDEEMTPNELKIINGNLNRKDRSYYPTEEMEEILSNLGLKT